MHSYFSTILPSPSHPHTIPSSHHPIISLLHHHTLPLSHPHIITPSHSLGGENLAVAQNNYAVLWFKGKELNMVFGLLLSISRVVRLTHTHTHTHTHIPYLPTHTHHTSPHLHASPHLNPPHSTFPTPPSSPHSTHPPLHTG